MIAASNPASPEMILAKMDAAFGAALQPDPDLTISQWSDQYRVLSRVSAGEPGRWRTSRTPFLRENHGLPQPVVALFARGVHEAGADHRGGRPLVDLPHLGEERCSPWAGRITSGSMSRCFTVGGKVRITSGVVPAIRVTCGS
jgi:hypothetical protein